MVKILLNIKVQSCGMTFQMTYVCHSLAKNSNVVLMNGIQYVNVIVAINVLCLGSLLYYMDIIIWTLFHFLFLSQGLVKSSSLQFIVLIIFHCVYVSVFNLVSHKHYCLCSLLILSYRR